MNEEKYITPQIVYVDELNRIMGITSPELGVEVITEYNCSCALTEDGIPLYKYENSEVLERTEAEIDADRVQPLIEPTLEERINDLEIAICELVDALAE